MYKFYEIQRGFGSNKFLSSIIFAFYKLKILKLNIIEKYPRRGKFIYEGHIKLRLLHPLYPIFFILVLILGTLFEGIENTIKEIKKVTVLY
jgi:hypothetical protein